MTDQSFSGSARLLLPCPFCGKPLEAKRGKINPYGRCMTLACFGTKMPVISLDVPSDVEAWNTRSAAPQPVATGEREAIISGSATHYRDAWRSAIYDATGDYVKTKRAMELAELNGLFDPVDALSAPQPVATGERKGFFENLTPEQQKAALEYDGPENHGDPAFASRPVATGERGLAEGCCSAASPCSHQKISPYTLCHVCQPPMKTVTIMVPSGYRDAAEFLKDCGFEEAISAPQPVATWEREALEKIISLTLSRKTDHSPPCNCTVCEMRDIAEAALASQPRSEGRNGDALSDEAVKRAYDAAWKIDLPLSMDEIRCLLVAFSSTKCRYPACDLVNCQCADSKTIPSKRTVPVLVPDKNSASGHRVEHLSIEVDSELARLLDAAPPSSQEGK